MTGSQSTESSATAVYAAAREGAVVVMRGDRAQLHAHGRDPVRMVQGLITNDLAGAPEDRAVYAAMLTPKGRMLADLRVVRQADGSLLLDLDAGALPGALAHVRKMVPPLYARFASPDPELRVLGVYGIGAAELLQSVLGARVEVVSEDAVTRAGFGDASVIAIASREHGVPGADLFVAGHAADALRAAIESAGAVPGDDATLEVLRIEAGRPRWGRELDEERIPLEANLLERAISTSKGCYTGQEVVIRILHRGHVNWQLRGLLLGEGAPLEAGAELKSESGKVVARVTSSTSSPALGQAVALAYVRREIEPGSVIIAQTGAAARVVELPFTTESAG